MKYAAAIATCALAASAQADIIDVFGSPARSSEQTGATFTGILEYVHNGGSSGTFLVTLANETPLEVGGYLTGFLFNIDSADPSAAASLSSTSTAFLDTGSSSGAPFGVFDAGAALDANWLGGGKPSRGIAAGDSGTFAFAVTAFDAASLSASSFAGGPDDFVVRFRGLEDGGSDKVPLPAPSGVVALALAGLFTARRRR